ncbi:protein kinase [bacterium]|nr:protein kinase [bacterium]
MLTERTECPESARLDALLADNQDAVEVDRIMMHLEDCEVCQNRLATLFEQSRSMAEQFVHPDSASEPKVDSDRKAGSWMQQLPRKRIGSFSILRKIGEGGMGEVFECRDDRLDRNVAVKRIRTVMLCPRLLEKLETEARIHGRLEHPGIVALHDFGVEEELPYLVMEYVEGGSLKDALRERRPSPRQAAIIVKQIAEAVQAAHTLGILHRDLKPGNILLKIGLEPAAGSHFVPVSASPFDGLVKVTDFGLAKSMDVVSDETGSMTFTGTPAYMAPEQLSLSAQRIGPQTDIYAMGVILYEMLCGRVPFDSDSLTEIAESIRSIPPISPRDMMPGIPVDLETIALKCLEKDPALRYESAADLAVDLGLFLENKPIHARPIGLFGKFYRWTRRNPREALAVGVAAASILAVGIGGFVTAGIQSDLRREAEGRKSEAEEQRRIADERLAVLQQKYFDELEAAKSWFLILREMSGPSGHIVAEKLDQPRIQSLYEKIIEHRYERAYDLISHPDFKNLHLEQIVEANYLSALQTLTFDRPVAYKQFQAAVDLAKVILAERPLNEIGRAAAINADNYLGVFQSQVENHSGALPHYRNAWDNYRLRPGEVFRNSDLKRFSVQVGRNLAETLEKLGRNEEARQVISEVSRIERMEIAN